jgi:hypothetical protein
MNFHFIRNLLIFSFLILLFNSCKTNNIASSKELKENNVIKEFSENYFNKNDSVKIIPNESGNLILYTSKNNVSIQNQQYKIKFFIYNKIENKIIYKGEYNNTQIKWYSEDVLFLSQQLGFEDIKTGQSTKNILINVKTNQTKKYNKNSNTL